MNRKPVKSVQGRRDMITKLKTKNSSSKGILHKLKAMNGRIGKRIVERVTVIKIRGGKRISQKNSSFQIKGLEGRNEFGEEDEWSRME